MLSAAILLSRTDMMARPGAAMYQIEDDKERDEDEHKARGERRNLGDAADAHGAVNNHLAALSQLKFLLDEAKVQTAAVAADVQNADNILDNLTECQGNDGEGSRP